MIRLLQLFVVILQVFRSKAQHFHLELLLQLLCWTGGDFISQSQQVWKAFDFSIKVFASTQLLPTRFFSFPHSTVQNPEFKGGWQLVCPARLVPRPFSQPLLSLKLPSLSKKCRHCDVQFDLRPVFMSPHASGSLLPDRLVGFYHCCRANTWRL